MNFGSVSLRRVFKCLEVYQNYHMALKFVNYETNFRVRSLILFALVNCFLEVQSPLACLRTLCPQKKCVKI